LIFSGFLFGRLHEHRLEFDRRCAETGDALHLVGAVALGGQRRALAVEGDVAC